MQAPVCCQEPIILVEGPWAEGQFCDIDYLECPFRYLFLFQPSGAAVPELPFCAGFCCPPCTLLLPASTLLAVVLWDLMDLLGSVRRDGLSTLASLPLCRFLRRLLAAGTPAGFWCRQSSSHRSSGSQPFPTCSWCLQRVFSL